MMASNTSRTRRQLLAAGLTVGLAAVAGCVESEPTDGPDETPNETTDEGADGEMSETAVETVVSIPGNPVPENMAFDTEGNLYFGITAGELRRVASDQLGDPDLTLEDTELVATLPGAIGVETAPDGTVYVAVSGGDEPGVWEVPPEGGAGENGGGDGEGQAGSDGGSGREAAPLAGIEGFANDMIFDADRERLLVTESNNGMVYSVGTDGSRSVWLDDDRLDTEGFGANGITRDGDTVYVAVTQAPEGAGRLLEVPVGDDGSAGEAGVVLESPEIAGADGIDADQGSIFVAANSQNRVLEVSGDEPSVVADAEDGLVFPSDVLVGPDGALYICNFANQSPEEGSILRTGM